MKNPIRKDVFIFVKNNIIKLLHISKTCFIFATVELLIMMSFFWFTLHE